MNNNCLDHPNNHMLKIFELTKDTEYISAAFKIITFVKDIYRTIELTHYDGKIIVFKDLNNNVSFKESLQEPFYDKGILNHDHESLIFRLQSEDELPTIWINIEQRDSQKLLSIENDFIAYIYENGEEYFLVNCQKILILNKYSCPSIFALQYHDLNEALLDYKNERVRTTKCEHFKNCWSDNFRIYLKNKPEECMQISLNEFLGSRIRGVTIDREYKLGASKPVDVRVFWREANRAALIEVKWLGQSLKKNGDLGTNYSNGRANNGMDQIKEYVDLARRDTPSTIAKGYLVVIDGRRKCITSRKVTSVSRDDGMHYAGKELIIKDDKTFWETYPNIEKPLRMFVEPICEK